MIEVRRVSEGDPLDFEVVVREGKGETRHHVTMSREMCERLTAGKHTPERCVEAAFRFLLEREPKESILGAFDATMISRYFPEFERELRLPLAVLMELCRGFIADHSELRSAAWRAWDLSAGSRAGRAANANAVRAGT